MTHPKRQLPRRPVAATQAPSLAQGLDQLGIELPEAAAAKLVAYGALLEKWNRVYNLTALRERQAVLTHHLLDSLAVLPQLRGASLADVGSGGGLPGIPLAIARPAWRVALVEANNKKATFLEQARIELGLTNVSVANERVESWRPPAPFDVVISRAFSDLAAFVRLTAHLLAPGGTFAAMKGVHPDEELAQLPAGFVLERAIPLTVPGVDGQRHLILLRRT